MRKLIATNAKDWGERTRAHELTHTEANPSIGLDSDMTLSKENNSVTIWKACKMSNFWFKCMGESRERKFNCFELPDIDNIEIVSNVY